MQDFGQVGDLGIDLGVDLGADGVATLMALGHLGRNLDDLGSLGWACWDILATMLDDIGPKMRPRG